MKKPEVWKVCSMYPGYEVSNHGQVRNRETKYILKQQIINGYHNVHLRVGIDHKNGKFIYVHRLVAMAFVPNPNKEETIDHIDRDRSNNYYENLRWVSMQENLLNMDRKNTEPRIFKKKTPIVLVDKETFQLIEEFKNPIEASEKFEISVNQLTKKIHQKQPYKFGFFMTKDSYDSLQKIQE